MINDLLLFMCFFSITMSDAELYYLQQISVNLQKNVFKCPWGGIIMRNSDDEGELLEFNILKDYKKQLRRYWLYLRLTVFRQCDGLFGVFSCDGCQIMKGMNHLVWYVKFCKMRLELCWKQICLAARKNIRQILQRSLKNWRIS